MGLFFSKQLYLALLLLFDFFHPTLAYSQFQEIIKIVKSGVVKVISKKENRFGSGFFINTKGNILTCAHVLKNDSSIEYERSFKIEYYAEVFDSSGKSEYRFMIMDATVDTIVKTYDVAILKANIIAAGLVTVRNLPFGNSDEAQDGDEIATCGFIPDGFTPSKPIVVKGIISAIREKVFDGQLNNMVGIFQLDQQTAGGLSGAPLFSTRLGVIGYMDASILPDIRTKQSGFSFALSINQIKPILKQYEYREMPKR